MRDGATDYVTVFYDCACLPIANGGNARVADLLDRLSREFARLMLYSYAHHADQPWRPGDEEAFRARWPGIELVIENPGGWLRHATRLKNLAVACGPSVSAPRLIGMTLPRTTPRFDAVKRRTGAFVVSYTDGLTRLNGVDPDRCIVDTHDLNFLKWSKMHGHRPVSATALRKMRTEMALLEACRAIVAIAPDEAAVFRTLLTRPSIFLAPSWGGATAAEAAPSQPPLYDLVFAGSRYVMNGRGLCALLDGHGQWLDGYTIAVCGGVCDDPAVRQAALRHPNVTLLGFVPDLAAVYARSRAALSPVDGTGLKMKVLGALAAGLPVFASRASRQGLPPGHAGAVFPIEASAMSRLFASEDRLRQASVEARRYGATLAAAGEASGVIEAIRALVPTNPRPATVEAAA